MMIAAFFRTLYLRVLPFNWRWAIMGPTDEEIASWKKWREELGTHTDAYLDSLSEEEINEHNRQKKLTRWLHSAKEQW
ncbi:MAG: hypothetical protein BZY82_01080 [SAR202 cluster bacterium Io17-Chloro-G3]|nr:MAG: hypothetical protein BZY82_01080 [SAR202 cluster bacterium Io17-Chloro-G3]